MSVETTSGGQGGEPRLSGHRCDNCDGIGIDTCAFNPHRREDAAVVDAAQDDDGGTCTTMGCPNEGTVPGVYDDGETVERVTYCHDCGANLAEAGEFTRDRDLAPEPTPAPEAPTDAAALVEEGMVAARRTREYRAGAAFDVPHDAVESYTEGILRAAIPVVERAVAGRARREALEEAAAALEARRPHIPPSTAPNRREALVERSTLNRAAAAVRALAAPATNDTEGAGRG